LRRSRSDRQWGGSKGWLFDGAGTAASLRVAPRRVYGCALEIGRLTSDIGHQTRRDNFLDYKTPGINRNRTFRRYSSYPARFATSIRSSSNSRQIKKGSMTTTPISPHHEPSASGVPIT